ncbi:hypothetical protein WR25_07830 [Diploscapter pachys]|uniref:FAD dependent oxidoreductase domain-containing protein n=1 Tax=Diploscapter pachys TaxID=2018661 RepID=A0A2A2JF10_9BILA|nr:hypothetical protein WR25_07830 [Diploscapter pachys]
MTLLKAAIVGEGVVGCSTALALIKKYPNIEVTVFHDRPFEQSCSFGPAGLFRIDNPDNKEYGRASFKWFAELYRTKSGAETGVKLVSGHIQSEDKEKLVDQERAYGDIVYNFRWLTDREINELFVEPSKYCIHYTAFAAEGNMYVPFLKQTLQQSNVKFVQREIDDFDKLAEEEYSLIFNCAGIDGAKLAGDDNQMQPNRGIAIEIQAPWHKHFNYRDFATFTIPKTDTIVLGSVKQDGRWDMQITDEDRKDIWERYLKLHPAMKGAKVVKEWCGLRPHRKQVRIEKVEKKTKQQKPYTLIHHYGHGSNGITLGWGTALRAIELAAPEIAAKSKL